MRGRVAQSILQAALATGFLLSTSPARSAARAAGPDEVERKNTARGLADYASQLYNQGDYEGAITAFKQADKIYHAPTLVRAWARASVKARHLLAARDLYKQVVDEPLPGDASEEFRAAQRSSRDELAAVVTTIPTLEVRVRGTPPSGGVQVTIDDKHVNVGEPTDVDPMRHVVKVLGAGAPRVQRVELQERAHQVVEIDLDAPVGDDGPSVLPGALILGGAGIGLIVGTIAGVVTLHNASVIKANCLNSVCPPSDMAKVASTNGVAALSTAGFVVAGAAGIVGTVLLVRAVQAKAAVTAAVGPGSVFVTGTF